MEMASLRSPSYPPGARAYLRSCVWRPEWRTSKSAILRIQPKTLDVIAEESVGIARKIELPAAKSITVPVSVITSSDGEAVKAELAIRWQSHVQKVKLRSQSPSPRSYLLLMRIFPAPSCFPRALERSERRAAFGITNSGGKPGSGLCYPPPPRSPCASEDQEFTLAPGETREVLIGIRALTSGPHEGNRKICEWEKHLRPPRARDGRKQAKRAERPRRSRG